ncbi:MAG: DinB family protein [Acidobacteriota bacterium]
MQQTPFNLDDAVAVLERTPATLGAMLEGLPENWTRVTEGDGTWSPYDVIGHLVHCERRNWMPRVRHILSGDRRPFEPLDRRAQFSEDQDSSLGILLAAFAQLRRTNMEALVSMNLTPEDLARTGHHPDFGPVTLEQLMATWVVHDLDHVVQVARTMAKAYAGVTGPWSAYLSVLRDRKG